MQPSNNVSFAVETIGEFAKVHLDPDHEEMFVIGYEGLALFTLAGQVLAPRQSTRRLSDSNARHTAASVCAARARN